MQDRFNFRGVLNIDYVAPTGEKKIAILSLRNVVISRWDKIEVITGIIDETIDALGLPDDEKDIVRKIVESKAKKLRQFCWSFEPDAIYQCTGKKDKNGDLIYEGDFVRDSNGALYSVIWEDNFAEFYLLLEIGTTDHLARIHESEELEIEPGATIINLGKEKVSDDV